MSKPKLKGKKIAVLVADGFEQVELTEPKKALEEAGAVVKIISPDGKKVQGFHHFDRADEFDADMKLDDASEEDFDGLVLPGGVHNPDTLRTKESSVNFVRKFFEHGKPVAAICHGPWTLIEADVIKGRRLTSWPSLRTDIKNAGGEWVDEEVVVDQGLVTSRKPDDLKAFCRKTIEEIAEGRH